MIRIISIFSWVLLLLTSALLAFKVNLHSDSLFLDALTTDILAQGGNWGDWKITPAPAYFPDMLLYFIAHYLLPTPVLRITFIGVAQALLLAFAAIKLAKAIRPNHSAWQSIIILLIISTFALTAIKSNMWLFFSSTNNHFAALLFPLLIGWMIFSYFDNPRFLKAFWIIAFAFAGAASTPVFMLSFTAPFFVFAFLATLLLHRQKTIKYFFIKIFFYILLGSLAAHLFNSALVSYDAFSGRAPLTLENAKSSLGAFISATKLTFARDNALTFLLSAGSLAAIVLVLIKFIKSFSWSIKNTEKTHATFEFSTILGRYSCTVIFLIIALPLGVLGSIASGGFVDPWGYRYFAFPIALGLLLFVVKTDQTIDKYDFSKSPLIGVSVVLAFTALAVSGFNSAKYHATHSGRETLTELFDKGFINPTDHIALCINKSAAEGFEFKSGVADFWNARGLIYKTDKTPFILPITNDLRPFFHMMTLGPLLNPEHYGALPYNFVIAEKSGSSTQFNLTPEAIAPHLPPPAKIVDCANSIASLWLYDGLELDQVMRKNIASFLTHLGKPQALSIQGSELPGETGRIEASTRVASATQDGPGFLTYGPYVKLPKGKYKVALAYQATADGNRWDAGRFNDPKEQSTVAAGLLPAADGLVNFEFELKKTVEHFEIRIWFDGHGSLALNTLSLTPDTHP